MRLIALCLCLSLSCNLLAQQKPSPIYVTPDAPEWMHLMLQDNPNVFAVQQAYQTYYTNNKFVKTDYTQYYKRWVHWARHFVQPDGSIHIPTPAEQQQREAQLKALRQSSKTSHKPAAQKQLNGWTFIGPNETYDIDGTTKVTWQTNIYCVAIAPSDNNILYAGGETGGVWKTIDKGLNWTLTTKNIQHGSFGAIQIHQPTPILYMLPQAAKLLKLPTAA